VTGARRDAVPTSGLYSHTDRAKALLKMSALQLHFLAYTFLRSVSNGVDHQYDTSFSMALSLTALAVGVIAAWRMLQLRIHRRVFTLLLCLSVFVSTSGLSFAVYVYLIMFVILLSSVYRNHDVQLTSAPS
jgi:hypothetical protein